MREFVVVPALRFADQDLQWVRAAVDLIIDRRPTEVLVTGLVDDTSCQCRYERHDRRCLPSEELLSRFREIFLQHVSKHRSIRVGYVGLADGIADSCGRRSRQVECWLEQGDVRPLPAAHELLPRWFVLGRARQSCRVEGAVPGGTGVAIARRRGASVVVGDTGRLGIGRIRIIGDGRERVLAGVEAGSLVVGGGASPVDRRRRSDLGVAVLTVDSHEGITAHCVAL